MIVEAIGWELEETPWMRRAECSGEDPELWFPERGRSAEEAVGICRRCAVAEECLGYAVRWRIGHGVWGGMLTRERRRLYGNGPGPGRLPAAHGTTTRYARGCRCGACREANLDSSRWREVGHLGGLDQVFYLVVLFLFIIVLLRVLKLV